MTTQTWNKVICLLTVFGEYAIVKLRGDLMKNGSVCHFIPEHKDNISVQIINFVLETEKKLASNQKTSSVYMMNYVLEGEGVFHTQRGSYPLTKGDIFFCLPASPYAIESGDDFQYMYISFLGTRANIIMDELKISAQNCVFQGFDHLAPFWKQAIDSSPAFSGLRSEGLLLYTFSFLKNDLQADAEESPDVTTALIKKYIDEHANDPDLSVEKISNDLIYNKKYISISFKKKYKIGIAEYINTVRIQTACKLMEQGLSNIAEIAFLCGYKDPLYFSKVFKTHLGCSPRTRLAELQKNNELK